MKPTKNGEEPPILNFFQCTGVYFKSYSELFRKSRNKQTDEEEYGIEGLLRKSKKLNWEEFHIPFKHDNRHQISNEWGAISLALNAGYEKSEISYDYPETLYFKFLQKKFRPNLFTLVERKEVLDQLDFDSIPSDKVCFKSLLQRKKVLLIDDNAEKGWCAVLEKLFDCDVNQFSFAIDVLNDKGKLKIKPDEFDIIFLDLYIPFIQTNKPELSNGLKILKEIKQTYPGVPVVVFTASNKAWTIDKVLNKGADGMYVKESPEYAGDEKYSKENFNNFVKIVSSTLEKYRVLRPFYEAIQKILNNQKFKEIEEKEKMELKERIRERLMMFYGLLKRGFEQTEFNKKLFHFSDYELAYMTLWSVLNEISEAYYEKSRTDITPFNKEGKKLTHHPNGKRISYLPHQFKWNIRGQSDDTFFIDYEYRLTDDSTVNKKGYYSLKYEQISPFSFKNNDFLIGPVQPTRIKLENTIFMQIAFLLEKMVSLASSNKTKYQKDLVDLNTIRNQLYLTHGGDNNSNYYAKTESEKRKAEEYNITPSGDIKRLFELIGFLLTGEDIRIQV